MNNFEQDFYQFVKHQLAKKRRQKDSSPNTPLGETDEMEKNRLVNQNVTKVLQQERKKMRIQKVSKEQQFDKRFKDFSNMDTFLDIKQFLRHLSNQKLASVEIKKKLKTLKKIDSDSDNDDLFDYADIIQRSKNIVENSTVIRHYPDIKGYLIQEEQPNLTKQDVEELKTEDDKFYNAIDKLFIDIRTKSEQIALQQKYEQERNNCKGSIQMIKMPQKQLEENLQEKERMDELISRQAKQFKQQTEKVLTLLEKTTKQLFNNKQKKGLSRFIKKKKRLTEPNQQLSEISEERTTLHQFYPETSRSTIKLPYLSPNTSKIYSHRTFLSQVVIPVSRKDSQIIEKVEPQEKIKNQFRQFIQKLDKTKETFDKQYQTDKELLSIQQRIIKNMNKIGEIPLESLRILNKKEVEANNLKLSKFKKLGPIQIL
ncbi:unnamed protein product (macronuclear) [Paramecium tetraurelia]|uniref:Uncharacterized protein n=1 Tax=Paramecium tetraurelia TaxID=5888 RepID=A0DPH4_PARTE|nr:uncharacterized protein GSPATT00019123001 [Paramecium tetraurelia]CAK84941.1 unnamed protein product [Paramecium tetraurelia]|eukprot:XP_001452338.1 hypothetical protein (macronuclear) [Paramecium tetraurelia strain d4-2]